MTTGATVAPSYPAVQEYFSDVSTGATAAPTSGAGIASYLSSLPVSSVRGGAGIQTHTGAFTSNSAIAGAGIASYLDHIASACDASRKWFREPNYMIRFLATTD